MTVSHLKSFLVSPWTILGSIVVGVLSGVYAPEFSLNFESLGSIYISLLKVVVLPFLLATILVGIIGLLQKEGSQTLIRKIIVGFVCSMFIAATIGVGTVVVTGSDYFAVALEADSRITVTTVECFIK
jgi:Na+/H+-dicarboxylate symporter